MKEREQILQNIIDAGLKLRKEGLIVRTWGNISARVSDTEFAITPSGRDYSTLTTDDLVIVDIKTGSYDTTLRPSGEVELHRAIYLKRSNTGFVIHTHQDYATILSITGENLIIDSNNEVFPCAKYAICCSDTLASNVSKVLTEYPDARGILLKGHGFVALGSDMEGAFAIVREVEEASKLSFTTACGSIISGSTKQMKKDYGRSRLDEGFVTLTIGSSSAHWPVGYAAKSDRKAIPRKLRAAALVHDAIYSGNPAVRNVRHLINDAILTVSGTDNDNFKKGFRPYTDDQAQLIGNNLRLINPAFILGRLANAGRLKRIAAQSNALLLKSGGALIWNTSADDVDACERILTKGCMAAIYAAVCNKASIIPRKTACKMRDIYVNSYSKLKNGED